MNHKEQVMERINEIYSQREDIGRVHYYGLPIDDFPNDILKKIMTIEYDKKIKAEKKEMDRLEHLFDRA